MKNPIVKVLEEKDLSITELAIIAGADTVAVRRVVKGEAKHLTGKVLEAIAQLGYERSSVAGDYLEWRKSLAEQMIAERGDFGKTAIC